jgi:hypothetical protein
MQHNSPRRVDLALLFTCSWPGRVVSTALGVGFVAAFPCPGKAQSMDCDSELPNLLNRYVSWYRTYLGIFRGSILSCSLTRLIRCFYRPFPSLPLALPCPALCVDSTQPLGRASGFPVSVASRVPRWMQTPSYTLAGLPLVF